MPWTNCEINLILTWYEYCIIYSTTGETDFAIIDTKPYVPIGTLSTRDDEKLLEKLKFGFKRTINWNKYQSRTKWIFRLLNWL